MLDNNALVAAATPVFFGLIALEAWSAHRRHMRVYRLPDSLTSLACGVWTVTLEVFTKSVLLLAFAWVAGNVAPWRFDAAHPGTWLLFFVFLDFLYYWAHRWSHEINLLWGGHSPHHQSQEYNLTTALRQGAFQDVLHMPLYLPLALLGCPPEVFITLLTFSKFYQFWIHTRMIGRVPFIEGILNTPSAHRVHHAVNDCYLDRNYGGTFMIWDRLFGTYVEEGEACVFGVREAAPGWNPVSAQFVWFAALWRDAGRTGRWLDKFAIWFRRTGWRPADVALADPHPPFDLAVQERRPAVRGGYWLVAALLLFVLAAAQSNVLIRQLAALALPARMALAAGVTVALLAMAWTLTPRRA